MIRIIHINTTDSGGGAANAASRLSIAMCKHGYDSKLLVLQKSKQNPQIIEPTIYHHSHKINKALLLMHAFSSAFFRPTCNADFGVFSSPFLGVDVSSQRIVQQADIIYLHWICGGYINIHGLKKILNLGKPVFWVMHDMWAITGGCHCSFDCDKYTSHCDDCQCLLHHHHHDTSWKLFEKKAALFDNVKNLHIITPSKWLASCVHNSELFGRNMSLSVIPNTVDTQFFKPLDKRIVRNMLGLPMDKEIILFCAAGGPANTYKGWKYLQLALNKLSESINADKIELLIVGSEHDPSLCSSIPNRIHFAGTLHDELAMVIAYNAVDILVAPSLADNFPYTILEAMLCGIPVVGFDVGGIPDLIKHMRNGYLAHYKDADDLAVGIKWVLENNLIAHSIRASTEAICNEAAVIQQHEMLWQL